MKKAFKFVFIIISFLFLFKGWLHRKSVSYSSIGKRQKFLIENFDLKHLIDEEIEDGLNVEEILKEVNKFVANQLSFSSSQNSNNPNIFYKDKKAHCVGYAQLYSSVCNYVFKKNNLDNEWEAYPHIGELRLFENNIHDYVNTPFFKDHDFIIVTNKKSKVNIAVDPSLYDYLRIEKVTLKE